MTEAETNMPMRLVVVGAGGRMGQALIRAIKEIDGVKLSGIIARPGSALVGCDAGEVAGVGFLGVTITDDPLSVFAKADAVLDFTTPDATILFAKFCAQTRIVHVIGTTGCSAKDEEKIGAAARHSVIVKSSNMSLGVNLLAMLVEKAARILSSDDFDIEILEMHHRHKVDAPSGTALFLGEAAAKGRRVTLAEKSVYGHTGVRKKDTIGFATLRGGSIAGDHSVMLAGSGECITLSHHAEDRSIFARGAIKAALWGRGRKPGLYSMRDVLGLSNDQ